MTAASESMNGASRSTPLSRNCLRNSLTRRVAATAATATP
jgi:hypothetical protein